MKENLYLKIVLTVIAVSLLFFIFFPIRIHVRHTGYVCDSSWKEYLGNKAERKVIREDREENIQKQMETLKGFCTFLKSKVTREEVDLSDIPYADPSDKPLSAALENSVILMKQEIKNRTGVK